MSFARTGRLVVAGHAWPPYDNSCPTGVFGADFTLVRDPAPHVFRIARS